MRDGELWLAARRATVPVIVNPVAGRLRAHRLQALLGRLRAAGLETEVRETRAPGDAEHLARAVIGERTGAPALLVAGGDGTLNEAINGMAGSALPLGILPLGTANVLAWELGVGAVDAAAEAIAAGEMREIHLGEVNGRVFTMMAGVGFDARVVAAVDAGWKRRIGKGEYVRQSLAEIARHQPTRYRLTLDDGQVEDAGSAIIANGHYYGGRFVAAPHARLDQPWFELRLFRRGRRIDALRYAAGLVLDRLDRLADADLARARTVRVDGPEGEPVQADGDIIARLPASISVSAHRLRVLAPLRLREGDRAA